MTIIRASVFFFACIAALASCKCDEPASTNTQDASIDATPLAIDASIDATAPACGCPTLQPGDMFTVCGPSNGLHYIIDPQGEVMYFPNSTNSDVFASWRDSDENLITITQPCFDNLWVPVMYPGGVNYRPGTHVVKRVGNNFPQLYVILPDNTLAPISAQVAAALCVPSDVGGVDCNPVEIADVFWPNFTHRAPEITVARVYPGLLFVIGTGTTVYYTDTNGIFIHEVSSAVFELNHFQRRFVRRVPQSAVNGPFIGAPMRIYEALVSDPAQGG